MSDSTTPLTDAVPPEIPVFLLAIEGVIRGVDLKAQELKLAAGNSIKKILEGSATLGNFLGLTTLFTMKMLSAYLLGSEAIWSSEAKALLDTIKLSVAGFLANIGLQFVISVHNLLSAVWEDYRLMFRGIQNAAAGLSNTIGMDAGFLSLALLNVQNVVTAIGVSAGADPAETQILFLTDMGSFLQRWSRKWRDYYHNPGMILDELQQWVLENSYRDDYRLWQKQAVSMKNLIAGLTKTTGDILNIETALNQFITDLPADEFDRIQEWYKPYHAEAENIRDNYVIPTAQALLEIQMQFEILATESDVNQEQYQNALASLPDILSGIYLSTSPEGISNRQLFEAIVKQAAGLGTIEDPDSFKAYLEGTLIIPTVQTFEPIEITVPVIDTATPKRISEPPDITGTVWEVIQGDVDHTPNNAILDSIGGDI